MRYEPRIRPTERARAAIALILIAALSGCASSGAPAPVEQRRPTHDSATPATPVPRSTHPAPVRTSEGERTLDQVQVTGLGNGSASATGAYSSGAATLGARADSARRATNDSASAVGAGQGEIVAQAAAGNAEPRFSVANPAVVALLNRANREASAGRHGASAASLERAIKIEPGNAWLWHRLAQTRLRQNQPVAAASLAARSNSLAGNDTALRARNWRMIASVHQQRGEPAAAREAQRKAERLERATS
ncbi:MAG: hypothetical protein ACI8W7_004894 [Gammaproteobacteria bacterium]|jgi:hypothetical protein